MKKLEYWVKSNLHHISKGLMLLGAMILIVNFFPRQVRFVLDYQLSRPWMHADLIAPYDFAVLKIAQEVEKDKLDALKDFKPFFNRQAEVAHIKISRFEEEYNRVWEQRFGNKYHKIQQQYLTLGKQLLDSVYRRGIISFEGAPGEVNPSYEFRLIDGHTATIHRVGEFFTISEAYLFISNRLIEESVQYIEYLTPLFENALTHNIVFNGPFTQMTLEAELERIPISRGMVQKGEKIISRGEVVNDEKFRILESYKADFQKQTVQPTTELLVYIGQALLVSISIIVLALFLFYFRSEVFFSNRRLFLILLSVLIMVFATSQMVKHHVDLMFLLPVCIVPITIRAFFDNRLALYVHIITIILIGFLVPRSFEFIFLQFIAGIIAILSMANMRRRSQLILTVLLIFITYSAVYFGLTLAQTGSLSQMGWINYAWFGGAALLTLFSYPLIFVLERIFALPTDFSLLELADSNNKLLRQLNLNAPGTFQHSLQVANLAEEAILEIGGNSLLTRTGALYHDIGKLNNPIFFTENQLTGFNPHDDIPREESARIIIDHIIEGIELARKYNLPEYVIDFIRTHHGSTTARYFYTMVRKEKPGQEIDPKAFTYPGPRPFSKETATVMMADSVEAASKSLRRPDEKSIGELVDRIIDTLIVENQFENANITFKDIRTIKKIFKKRLMNIFHVRIAYPGIT